MTTARRRSRGGRSAQEPPTTGSAAVDPEPDPYSVARSIALRQLTGAPRSRAQLREAMAKRDVPDDVAEAVLDRLEQVSLVDDAAYAEMWVRSRHTGRGLARRALAHELRHRGVDDETAAAALDELDDEQELQTARALVDRRLRASQGLDRDARIRRLAGMLARKGYSSGVALRVVRDALGAESEHDAEGWEPAPG